MKIVQITHFGSLTNYGALLQAYALQQALKELGHDPLLLRAGFSFNNILRKWYKSPLRVLKAWHKIKTEEREERLHPRKFREFAAARINLSEKYYNSHRSLLCGNIQADAMVTGSDQVWSGKKPFPPYFLEFGPAGARRFSYAASIGSKARCDRCYLSALREKLSNFQAVSVRESEALKQCQLAGITNAVLVPDPVMLFTPEYYRQELELDGTLPEQKYCLIYTVGRSNIARNREILDYCREHDLQTVTVAAQHQNSSVLPETGLCYPEIPQFLNLIDHAEMVITDSFHGTVFSLLFNTPIAVIPKNDHDARFDTLDEYFDLAGCFCRESFRKAAEHRFDFEKINRKLAELRSIGWNFLRSATGDEQ